MIASYILIDVPTGEAYSNHTGEGNIVVKVRAITRSDTGTITEKRGVALSTNSVADAPEFVLNVYKNWDGRGELQYSVYENTIDPATDTPSTLVDKFITIS